VSTLQDRYGFDVVDTGGLAQSWRSSARSLAYCIPLDRAGMERAIARAQRDVELPHGSWRK
jgi:hypothetical protein